jgi:hypothetical protein
VAISLDGSTSGNGNAATSVSITPAGGTGTAAQRIEIITFAWRSDPGAITAPGGWAPTGIQNSVSVWGATYTKSAVSAAETWSWANSSDYSYSVVSYVTDGSSWTLDQSSKTTGNDNAPTTGSVTTTSASELLVACFAEHAAALGALTFSAPTNSFSIIVQQENNNASNRTASGISTRVVASTGTYSTGVTSTQFDAWTAAIVTFAESAGTPYTTDMFPRNPSLASYTPLGRPEVIGY